MNQQTMENQNNGDLTKADQSSKSQIPDSRFDKRIFDLIPHRPPMMLINKIISLDESNASSLVYIDDKASFFESDKGVPSWIGIEYMGQTAALIAGYRLEKGMLPPHLGFLIGTRAYKSSSEYFTPGTTLKVTSKENSVVAEGFAKFDCFVDEYDVETGNTTPLATASLSVYRRLLDERS